MCSPAAERYFAWAAASDSYNLFADGNYAHADKIRSEDDRLGYQPQRMADVFSVAERDVYINNAEANCTQNDNC